MNRRVIGNLRKFWETRIRKIQIVNARALYRQRHGRLTIEITYVHRNHVLYIFSYTAITISGEPLLSSFSLTKYPHFLFQDFPCWGTFGTSFVHLYDSRNNQKIQENYMLRILQNIKLM